MCIRDSIYAEHNEVRANRIGARLVNHERKEVCTIDMSCPWIESRAKKDEEKTLKYGPMMLDCEQSLFFFRFSESNARARERRSRETCETRAAAREEDFFHASPVSRHQSRAWPFACLAFCSTDYRKKRDCS